MSSLRAANYTLRFSGMNVDNLYEALRSLNGSMEGVFLLFMQQAGRVMDASNT